MSSCEEVKLLNRLSYHDHTFDSILSLILPCECVNNTCISLPCLCTCLSVCLFVCS